MGKKTKIGKQRKDKFYFLAKEAGFRSRAAFKLLQLNKRFEFLQNSRALVDLCAAPGGWLQVAEQNMPVSSLRIGVDLVPIKPIRNCITLQGDITEEKTRHAVRKELGTWEADCVLNDGAPNVGTNWAHDAFQQNCLTLSALRLATQILRRGGYFVTKIFRSADSQSLISVFEKLFKKVHVWKPAASRLESAEIFVFCERYLKPEKVDSELLDVKKVFSAHSLDANDEKVNLHRLLLHPGRKEKKAKAIGYEEGEIGQHKELPVSEFLASKNALELLSRASSLVLDSERAAQSEHTTPEIRECLRDVKVCGPAEVRGILAWRKKLVAEQKSEERKNAVEEAKKTTEMDAEADKVEEEESKEMKELEEIDELIRNAKAEEKSKLKKRKKKLLKDKRKLAERKKLQMVHEGDTPTLSEDLELFSLRTVRKMADKTRERAIAMARAVMGKYIVDEGEAESTNEEEEDCAEIVDDKHEVEAHEMEDQKIFAEDSNGSFKKDEWEGDQSDSGEENDGLGELDDEEGDGGTERRKNGQKKRPLTAEQLAMGEHLIHSRKKACDLEDWAWNRYTSNDDGLPDWFTSDEKKHCRLQPFVDKTRVAFYAQRDKDLNVRTIRKVVEANMRKRQRRFRKLERAKKRAEGIVANEQMEHGEKIKELKKIYKKAGAKEKKQVKYQVVTKAKRGAMTRPRGPFKLVDKRLRKDNRAMKRAAKGGGGKRMGKGGAKRPAGRRANGPSAKKKKN